MKLSGERGTLIVSSFVQQSHLLVPTEGLHIAACRICQGTEV